MRCTAVERLGLSRGDRVLEIGCGTGNGFPFLQNAIGLRGKIYGIDISPRMLDKAKERCNANNWRNADYTAPGPIDAILFSLSYNTMPHHRMVLRRAWDQLRPGGRLVIMDAKVPSGPAEKIVLPFSLWLMKHTMLGKRRDTSFGIGTPRTGQSSCSGCAPWAFEIGRLRSDHPGRMLTLRGSLVEDPERDRSAHIASDCRLSDLAAELEQFTMNMWGAQSGFARLISPMSVRNSGETFGLPTGLRDRQRQYARNPARCQRMIVSGMTIAIAPRTEGNQ
jgi:SAM-dependent methyltransferase